MGQKYARLNGGTHNTYNLSGREKDYQAFLFYKYFFANEQPLIVTEGKTDVRYIRAALKNLYAEYPLLVEKANDGSFRFKISFFNRSKRWKYFYGMSMDGADAIKNIVRFYSSKSKSDKNPNYDLHFRNLCGHCASKPVILVFDNETKTKRPLSKFLSDNGVKGEKRESLQRELYLRLIPNSNLYLATNPLTDGKDECEIEDLFLPEVWEHKINDKTFSSADEYDVGKYYGKEIFSKYIADNYAKIDFSRFRPLLDSLVKSIDEYKLENESKKEAIM